MNTGSLTGKFPLGLTSCKVSCKNELWSSYRINSYRMSSHESNSSQRKKSTGSQSYKNPEQILWMKGGLTGYRMKWTLATLVCTMKTQPITFWANVYTQGRCGSECFRKHASQFCLPRDGIFVPCGWRLGKTSTRTIKGFWTLWQSSLVGFFGNKQYGAAQLADRVKDELSRWLNAGVGGCRIIPREYRL
jgi:hypothetical protein